MSISTGIPANWKLPLFWAVVDGSQAGNLTESQPSLLIGQAFMSGGATAVAHSGIDRQRHDRARQRRPRSRRTQASASTRRSSPPPRRSRSRTRTTRRSAPGVVGTEYAARSSSRSRPAARLSSNNDEFDITVTALPLGSARLQRAGPDRLARHRQAAVRRRLDARADGQRLPAGQPDPAALVHRRCRVRRPASRRRARSRSRRRRPPRACSTSTSPASWSRSRSTRPTRPPMIATNLVAAINAMTTLPVKAAVDGAITAQGRPDLPLARPAPATTSRSSRTISASTAARCFRPASSLTIGAMSGGTGNPDFTAAISAIQAQAVLPFRDALQRHGLAARPGTPRSASARPAAGPTPASSTAGSTTYRRDNYADLLTWGLTQNSPVISTMALEPAAPTPGVGVRGRLLRAGLRGAARRSGPAAADPRAARAACRRRSTSASARRS